MFSFLKALDSVLPPRCPFTGEIVDSPGMISPEAWKTLSFVSAPYCDSCGFPFEFAIPKSGGGSVQCAACLADPPEFKKARTCLYYDNYSRDFILSFKHGDQTQLVVAMVPWFRQAGADLWEGIEGIVPVPLHPWRLLRRRYNQAALIGAAVGKDRNIPFMPDALLRVRATQTQGHLKARERGLNVKGAFTANKARLSLIKDKTILLIDDVYTTGSTVRECTRALLKAGVKEVRVLTLARVCKGT